MEKKPDEQEKLQIPPTGVLEHIEVSIHNSNFD
jgi:hypothetical protein